MKNVENFGTARLYDLPKSAGRLGQKLVNEDFRYGKPYYREITGISFKTRENFYSSLISDIKYYVEIFKDYNKSIDKNEKIDLSLLNNLDKKIITRLTEIRQQTISFENEITKKIGDSLSNIDVDEMINITTKAIQSIIEYNNTNVLSSMYNKILNNSNDAKYIASYAEKISNNLTKNGSQETLNFLKYIARDIGLFCNFIQNQVVLDLRVINSACNCVNKLYDLPKSEGRLG